MTTTSRPRRGRRPAGTNTRGAIVGAARSEFAERGYDGTSLREVARRAGVDPALVHHYFGGKNALFTAAMDLPMDPREGVAAVVAAGVDGVGERLVRLFLTVWDPPTNREPMLGLLRVFRVGALARPLAAATGDDDVELRASLVVSQLIGLAMGRYVVRIEPLVSASVDQLVARAGPVLQGYLVPKDPA
jgi:AcrR family transcriptional regulator